MRHLTILALISMLGLLAGCAGESSDRFALPFTQAKAKLVRPVRLVLGSDSHDSPDLIDRFVEAADGLKPDLVIHAGDFQQYGSPGEWRTVSAHWRRLKSPMVAVPGNHEHRRDGLKRLNALYGPVPRAVDRLGLHIVLLDDGAYRLGSQLDFLARDLAAHPRARTLVVMHVPLRVPPQLGWMHLLEYLPSWHRERDHPEDHLDLANADGDRLEALMKRYGVDALICGHQHVLALDQERDRVPSLNLGTIGGYLPALGEAHTFLTATVSDQGMALERHALDQPPPNPLALVDSWRAYDERAHALETTKP